MNYLKSNEKNKGITLIALVVTIVVLLILAGTTIAMLIGNNRNYNPNTKSKSNNWNCTN